MPADKRDVRNLNNQAFASLDEALDKQALALMDPFADALRALIRHLHSRGLSPIATAQFLVGAVMAETWEGPLPGLVRRER
jgi:hypothetical protein